MSATSPQFLKLPDDILLEVLAQLPAFLVVLCFRPVCRRIDQLSRERHLWVRFFHRTEHILRRPMDLKRVGTSEFEINICRAEMLREKWGNEDALWIVPRFWRGAPHAKAEQHTRYLVAIMGDYIIVRQRELHGWISIHTSDTPNVCSFAYPSKGWIRSSYMDLRTGTFYLTSVLENSLNVMGIQVDSHGPDVRVEYSLPLRPSLSLSGCFVDDGFVVVHYLSSTLGREIDVIDLDKKTLSRLSLPPHPLILQQTVPYTIRRTLATEMHIIEIYGERMFAVFKRPPSSRGVQQSGINTSSLPLGITPLEPLFEGSFPWPISPCPYIIPQSATSIAMVVIPQGMYKIHVFLFTVSEVTSSVEDICSVDFPQGIYNIVLPTPLSTARYALGVLGVTRYPPYADETQKGSAHFAIRIDFPDPELDSALTKGQGNLTLQRMHLIPAVNIPEEDAIVRYFDCFSGKVCFFVHSDAGVHDLVLDYLSLY